MFIQRFKRLTQNSDKNNQSRCIKTRQEREREKKKKLQLYSMYRLISLGKNGYSRIYWKELKNMSNLIGGSEKLVESSIRSKLTEALKPAHIEILNESYMHNVPKGSETHFKVVVVSESFNNQPLIKRHRIVNELLSDELKNSVHALSIVAKTPAQWEESSKIVQSSPACRGGFGK